MELGSLKERNQNIQANYEVASSGEKAHVNNSYFSGLRQLLKDHDPQAENH